MNFRRGGGKSGIGLVMNDRYAYGAVGMVRAVVVVVERLTKKGKEKDKDEKE